MSPNLLPEIPGTATLWRTAQLREAGMTSRTIEHHIQAGQLVRLRRGCYARGSWWNGLDRSARRRQLIFAHAHGTLTTSPGSGAVPWPAATASGPCVGHWNWRTPAPSRPVRA